MDETYGSVVIHDAGYVMRTTTQVEMVWFIAGVALHMCDKLSHTRVGI